MSAEPIDNNIIQYGEGNEVDMHVENQQAKTIINANKVDGGININNYNTIERNEIKPANKYLCRNLIEAIQDYSPKVKNFLEMTIDDSERANWETQDSYLNKAKDLLISSYASVLGDFLRKLMGSDRQRDYFGLSQAITKRTLQLLCFSFVSSLWDQPKDKIQQINPEQLKLLKKLFFTGVEPNISYYADLFRTLVIMFGQLQLEYPFEEIKTMEDDFNGENEFLGICKTIDAFRIKFGEDASLPSIDDIEKALTSFLVKLNFLAGYKMVSVKAIGYEAVRKNVTQFLHTYSLLGVNKTMEGDGQRYSYQDSGKNTDAVLLIRNKYPEGLSLFPFIIDINALRDQRLVKICFYAWNDDNDKTLVYYDLNKIPFDDNDDSDVIIEKNKELEEIENDLIAIYKSTDRDITGWKANDGEKYKKMKLYEVFNTFKIAKETFFGVENI